MLEYATYDIYSLYTRKTAGLILREEHVKNIMHQILSALQYLHSTQYVMHRVRVGKLTFG